MEKETFPLERLHDEGRINIVFHEPARRKYGNRVIILGAGTFIELQKGAEDILGDEASAVFYEAGIRSGKEGAETMMEEYDERGLELIERVNDLIGPSGMGWGKIEVFEIDLEQAKGYYRISDSFIGNTYGPSDKPVCHFLCGLTAGMLGGILGVSLTCEETKCQAKGDPYCEFHFERY